MARIDRLKEEIGWLKVTCGLLTVVDASLLGWLAQSYAIANFAVVLAAGIAATIVSGNTILINYIAYRRFNDIEKS